MPLPKSRSLGCGTGHAGFDPDLVDEADIPVASFLARCNGRTLEAYRYTLRCFFQWAADTGLVVLDATRLHIEVYRCWLDLAGAVATEALLALDETTTAQRNVRPVRSSLSVVSHPDEPAGLTVLPRGRPLPVRDGAVARNTTGGGQNMPDATASPREGTHTCEQLVEWEVVAVP